MASVTLAESAKLSQDMLVSGVIENIVTVNRFYDVLPFTGIEGNAITYNRENALGGVENLGVGGVIGTGAGKDAATFTQVTASLTTIIGDAEVNGLIQATRSNFTDQAATQIASKAKSVGRTYQNQMVNGDGTSNTVEGLLALVAAGQTISSGTNGASLSLDNLDTLLDQVKDKDGEVDFLMMNSRDLRGYYKLLRAANGATINETVTLPSGVQIPAYRGVPIFRNDWMPIDQDKGTSTGVASTVFAGTLDDGSNRVGISGLTAMNNFGIGVEDVGTSETKDERIYRVKFYCGLAVYSDLGLAALDGVLAV